MQVLWLRLKALAEEQALSEQNPPSLEQCSDLVRGIVRRVLGSQAVIADEAVRFYAAELLDFIERYRKLHNDTATLTADSILKPQ